MPFGTARCGGVWEKTGALAVLCSYGAEQMHPQKTHRTHTRTASCTRVPTRLQQHATCWHANAYSHAQGGREQAESALAKAAVADWLDCVGEYECQPPIGHNEALGSVVAELDALARPQVAPGDLPQIQHLPLKICVVGTPFGGARGGCPRLCGVGVRTARRCRVA